MSEAQDCSLEMFSRSDAKDVDGWTALMAEDIRAAFSNSDPLDGGNTVHATIAGSVGPIHAIKHDVLAARTIDDKLIQKLQVAYTRLDGSVLRSRQLTTRLPKPEFNDRRIARPGRRVRPVQRCQSNRKACITWT